MTRALRHKVERFDRFQRQFARTRHRRGLDDFRRSLDELILRTKTLPAPGPTPISPAAPALANAAGRAAYDQQMRDLLVRVHGHPPLPDEPTTPRIDPGPWWSPQPVIGYRAWQLIEGRFNGARLAWTEPSKVAECLHRSTDPDLPIPHDVADCRRPPCGIYAVKEALRISRMVRPWFQEGRVTVAVGGVAMSGRVIEHNSGYRAGHARVTALAVLSGGRDSCDLTWVDDPDELTALFAGPTAFLSRAITSTHTTKEAFAIAFSRLKVLSSEPATG